MINVIPFIITISQGIHFCTEEVVKNEKAITIATSIKQVIQTYHGRGFNVQNIMGDGQFEKIRKLLDGSGINLNITGHDEHIQAVERLIHTVKERTRANANELPFETYPHPLIVEMVYNIMFWINSFPHKDGIHNKLSPRTIMTGTHIDHNKHCKLEFGSYVQVYKQHDNSLLPIKSGTLALRPTGNAHGAHYFLSLDMGRRNCPCHTPTRSSMQKIQQNLRM